MSGIIISGNTITNSDQGLRIKTDASATSASVTNVTYSGNTGTGLRLFGVLIDQVHLQIIFDIATVLIYYTELPRYPRHSGHWLHNFCTPFFDIVRLALADRVSGGLGHQLHRLKDQPHR